ncbi:MAG TPA: anhydro-N-acetylmuramic acid kinase [Nitrosospira sp.]|nr:anhydro-N-acetylmuramic acid kinase [Nitrosospira sp.]
MEAASRLKDASYYIGIMSGTSLDGIDAVLADFGSAFPSVIRTFYLPYTSALRSGLLGLSETGSDELHRAAMLGNELAQHYSIVVSGLLDGSGISPEEVSAVGCHGQTVRHCPQMGQGYTIQLFNPALLAELTGITVVADFRSRDIAAGGQGAPLVPAFHKILFSDPRTHRIVVNIGGISNLTSLAPGNPVAGFDCGPGNILMDAWCLKHTGQAYDKDGSWAGSGSVIPSLLQELIALPFFSTPPPKSTGREIFNLDWLESQLSGDEEPDDVQATLLQLTVQGIAAPVLAYYPDATEIYLCGGGARNTELVKKLRIALSGKSVELTDKLGVDADWLEAFAFAWLAEQALNRIPASLPAVTGARGPRILGAIYPN